MTQMTQVTFQMDSKRCVIRWVQKPTFAPPQLRLRQEQQAYDSLGSYCTVYVVWVFQAGPTQPNRSFIFSFSFFFVSLRSSPSSICLGGLSCIVVTIGGGGETIC